MYVRPARVSFLESGATTGEAFLLELRGGRGRLVVDPALALALVSGVVGRRPLVAMRPLGATERGVVAAVAVGTIAAAGLGGAIRVGLDPEPPLEGDILTVVLRVRAGGAQGQARLELPVGLLPVAPPAGRVPPSRVTLVLRVELARTTLDGASLDGAGSGDAIVFDGFPAVTAAAPWPVRLHLGAATLPADLHPDGGLRRRGPLTVDDEERTLNTDSTDDTQIMPAPVSDEAARALAAAPVEIVAELGRISLRGDELVGLLEGGVLTLGGRRPARVQLRVGERLWAVGELVAVDDELAVRITELVR